MLRKQLSISALFLFLSVVSLNAYSSTSQHHPPYQISYIEIIPSHVSIPAGFSTHIYVQCYDAFGRPVPQFWLRYWVVDFYGRYVQNVMWLNNSGILQVSSFAPRGPYRLYFQDTNGPASAFMDVTVY